MDAEKIRGFLLHHIEKVILVLVVAVSTWLVYQGLQHEDILQTLQPDRLIAEAQAVREQVDVDRSEMVLAGRKLDLDIPDKLPPLDPGPPDPPLNQWDTFSAAREDPVLLAPRALQVHGVLAPMAVRSTTGVYELQKLAAADPIKAEPETKQRGSEETDLFYEAGPALEDDVNRIGVPVRRLRNPSGTRPAKARSVPEIGWFIAGTAAMPYKALCESYEQALALADVYDPMGRDRPRFIGYQLQRADVTEKSVDQLQETDWVDRDGSSECAKDAALRWSGFAPEIVPGDYRADATLTMWIPPVMLTDYSMFSLHPLIPMLSRRQLAERKAKQMLKNRPVEVDPDQIEVRDARAGNAVDQRREMRPGFRPLAPQVDKTPPDYQLIRFYDFATDPRDPDVPRPRRKYVYRVRVALEDPNFPQDPLLQPRGSSLETHVYERIMKLADSILSADKPVYQRYLNSQRWTDWSQVSAPVSLPGRDSVCIGPLAKRTIRQVQVGDRLVGYERKPPKANLVISQFSRRYKTRLSMLMNEVSAGTVLSTQPDNAEIVDPITLEVKKLPDANIVSAITVIDIDGGHPLRIQAAQGLVSPSLMLLFDPNGGLQVHEESDDQEFYRIESFADERGE